MTRSPRDRLCVASLLILAGLAGCGKSELVGPIGADWSDHASSDADSDGDSDTDADGDGDGDTDTDADADTATEDDADSETALDTDTDFDTDTGYKTEAWPCLICEPTDGAEVLWPLIRELLPSLRALGEAEGGPAADPRGVAL